MSELTPTLLMLYFLLDRSVKNRARVLNFTIFFARLRHRICEELTYLRFKNLNIRSPCPILRGAVSDYISIAYFFIFSMGLLDIFLRLPNLNLRLPAHANGNYNLNIQSIFPTSVPTIFDIKFLSLLSKPFLKHLYPKILLLHSVHLRFFEPHHLSFR